jgi:hypothetical protein
MAVARATNVPGAKQRPSPEEVEDTVAGKFIHSRRAAWIASIVAGVLLLAGLGTLVVLSHRHPRDTTALANQRPSKLPGATPPTVPVATSSDGTAVTCPVGTVPEANITDASFAPKLSDGRSFGVGTYQITLHGRVLNETSAPITVSTVSVLVNGKPWHGKFTAATSVPAQDSVSFVAEGSYQSPQPATAAINTEIDWDWATTSLRPCGHRGLVHEH